MNKERQSSYISQDEAQALYQEVLHLRRYNAYLIKLLTDKEACASKPSIVLHVTEKERDSIIQRANL